MIIKFNNWGKFQPRKDYVHPWWFAFANDFSTNPNFALFSNEERLVFVYLLCEASKQAKDGELEVLPRVFSRIVDVKERSVIQAIEKLIQRGICTECVQNRAESVTHTTEQDITKQNNTKYILSFDALYDKYPRKEGKTEGFDRLRTMIKTEEEIGELSRAIDNYISYLKANGVEPRFYKLFPTFLGTSRKQTWRDWLEVGAGTAVSMKRERDYSFFEGVTMTRQEFATQVDRLKDVYGDKQYANERVEIIWNWAKNISNEIFSEIVSKLIIENVQTPMIAKFQEAYSMTRKKFVEIKSSCNYCGGGGFYVPRGSEPLPTVFACRCPAGESVPQYVARWNGILERIIPTPAELAWRNVTNVVSSTIKKME